MHLEQEIRVALLEKEYNKKMIKWTIVIKIIVQFLKDPSSSYFVAVERVCKNELKKRPDDFYTKWFLGELYVQYNKHEEALKILEPIYNSGRGGRKLKKLLARAYYNVQNYDKVINILEEKDIKNGDSATYYLGISLIETNHVKEGIDYLKKYLAHHPKDYMVHWKLGYEYYQQGQYSLALAAYKNAEKINPLKKEIKEGIDLCIKNIDKG